MATLSLFTVRFAAANIILFVYRAKEIEPNLLFFAKNLQNWWIMAIFAAKNSGASGTGPMIFVCKEVTRIVVNGTCLHLLLYLEDEVGGICPNWPSHNTNLK